MPQFLFFIKFFALSNSITNIFFSLTRFFVKTFKWILFELCRRNICLEPFTRTTNVSCSFLWSYRYLIPTFSSLFTSPKILILNCNAFSSLNCTKSITFWKFLIASSCLLHTVLPNSEQTSAKSCFILPSAWTFSFSNFFFHYTTSPTSNTVRTINPFFTTYR